MEFQDVFQYIGDLGLYQILMFFTLGIISMINGFQGLAPNFFLAPMNHLCDVGRLDNFSYDTQMYVAIPFQDGGDTDEYASCKMYDLDYDSLSDEDILTWNRSTVVNSSTIECSSGWVYDRWEFESTIVSKVTPSSICIVPI